MVGSPQVTDSVAEQAQSWVIQLHSGNLTASDREQFRAWLDEAPEHSSAYARVEQFWRDLSLTEVLAPVDAVPPKPACRSGTGLTGRVQDFLSGLRPVQWGMAAAILLLAVGFSSVNLFRPASETASYTTAIGELREIELADGSQVLLGARSSMVVSLRRKTRDVELVGGQAFFKVSKDVNRPFSVVTRHTRVTVTGTAFDVTASETGRVAVLEGSVNVESLSEPEESRVGLTAGQQVVSDQSGVLGQVEPVKGMAPGAWRDGRLSYVDVPLAQLVADVNRYYRPGVQVEGEALKSIRINTSFTTDQVVQMLTALAGSHGLEVKKLPNGHIKLLP